ncbi:transglutaminase family protein [Nocardia sp. CNY236]|uniref:transglutaminase-like domain-containing protein n=1 Tax=Nocardia sp. CNY236 TaxID=1169152 RepID=UPI0004188D6F|nr:transglutaminase family protein [Nocardia sp. CNY236]
MTYPNNSAANNSAANNSAVAAADDEYLRPTPYANSDHPIVVAKTEELTSASSDVLVHLGNIYRYVRDIPYDILASFRYLAEGKSAASDVIEHDVAFCMGKANTFVALCRAAKIPARVAFQSLDAPEMEFLAPEVRRMCGGRAGRPLPWHSLGEAFLHGRWIKLDATIDAPTAQRLGKPYTVEFDGRTDIPTVEGAVLRDNGSYADYPPQVAAWYMRLAREVLGALDSDIDEQRVAADDRLWAGPDPDLVRLGR